MYVRLVQKGVTRYLLRYLPSRLGCCSAQSSSLASSGPVAERLGPCLGRYGRCARGLITELLWFPVVKTIVPRFGHGQFPVLRPCSLLCRPSAPIASWFGISYHRRIVLVKLGFWYTVMIRSYGLSAPNMISARRTMGVVVCMPNAESPCQLKPMAAC